MTDNYENQGQNIENNNSWTKGNQESIKLLTVALCSFLGAFLAMLLFGKMTTPNKTFHPPLKHSKTYQQNTTTNDDFFDADEIFKEINKDFELMTPKFVTPINTNQFKIVHLEETDDNYKLIIDLKHFYNDEKNVSVEVKPNQVKISGKASMESENAKSSFSYFQELPLYKKVDVNDIKKEKIGNKYVITIPFKD